MEPTLVMPSPLQLVSAGFFIGAGFKLGSWSMGKLTNLADTAMIGMESKAHARVVELTNPTVCVPGTSPAQS